MGHRLYRVLGGAVSVFLIFSCAEEGQTPAPRSDASTGSARESVEQKALVFPDTLGCELAAVTVVDGRWSNYHLVGKEDFHLLKRTDPDTRFFHHLQIGSAVELEELFARLQANPAQLSNVSVASLPGDLGDLPVPRKKEIFFRVLLPLIAFHNERVEVQRRQLERLAQGGDLEDEERLPFEEMSRYYRLDEYRGRLASLADTLKVLLERVDRIPPSLALAQAAIESGWGSSRFSREGNNLFGQRIWSGEGAGLKPVEIGNPRFHLAVFPTIGASIRSYMRNLNTHPAYEDFRRLRGRMRRQEDRLASRPLAETLLKYSTRGRDYVDDVRRFIDHNRLTRFDAAALAVTSI